MYLAFSESEPLSQIHAVVREGSEPELNAAAAIVAVLNRHQVRYVIIGAFAAIVALVRAGAVFVNGKLVERPGEDAPLEAA